MTENIVEFIRKVAVQSCFELGAFKAGWPMWQGQIHQLIGNKFQSSELLNIGDNLSRIFATTGTSGRSQSEVSGAGYGWEGLICWYLNLCFIGSRAVAIRKASDVPLPLREAITVNYGNFRSNTESDIIVVIFPAEVDFEQNIYNLSIDDSKGNPIPTTKSGIFNLLPIAHRLAEIHFHKFELGIIQCKTNWNDNAQIPMLWSMVYEATDFKNKSISVGRNGYSLRNLTRFSYSFCTVPSNNLDQYRPESTSVNRVRNLSGGNYWGYPSRNGVASSIKEIYNANFQSAFSGKSQRILLNEAVELLSTDLSYFQLLLR